MVSLTVKKDNYGFDGEGTVDEPYLIDGYNITDSTAHLIHIENTTKYFNITNCYLNSSNSVYHCIWMKNVTFGTVADNTICNTSNYGIGMDISHNNTLLNNTVYDCFEGMYVSGSNDNAFTNNTIYNCFSEGIALDGDNDHNTLTGNTINPVAR